MTDLLITPVPESFFLTYFNREGEYLSQQQVTIECRATFYTEGDACGYALDIGEIKDKLKQAIRDGKLPQARVYSTNILVQSAHTSPFLIDLVKMYKEDRQLSAT
jgi:hypothetical protein